MGFNCRTVTAALVCWLVVGSAAAKWVQCADYLEQLQEATSEARGLSRGVASMESQIVTRRSEYLR